MYLKGRTATDLPASRRVGSGVDRMKYQPIVKLRPRAPRTAAIPAIRPTGLPVLPLGRFDGEGLIEPPVSLATAAVGASTKLVCGSAVALLDSSAETSRTSATKQYPRRGTVTM